MTIDFHVYVDPEQHSFVIDNDDPQLAAILTAMADVFQSAGRARECDECRHAAKNLANE